MSQSSRFRIASLLLALLVVAAAARGATWISASAFEEQTSYPGQTQQEIKGTFIRHRRPAPLPAAHRGEPARPRAMAAASAAPRSARPAPAHPLRPLSRTLRLLI